MPEKYWRTRPFVEASAQDYEQQQIDELLQALNAEAERPGLQELEWAVRKWRNDAFNPHLVARTRTVAFQKAVVMKYIDNLVAWGDSLFQRETREAVAEATQLYILAAKLLGPRPRRIPKDYGRTEYSYADLAKERPLDAFSNALVEIESLLPAPANGLQTSWHPYQRADAGRLDRVSLAPSDKAWRALVKSRSFMNAIGGKGRQRPGEEPGAEGLYFCVPPNDKLLDKWDVVADRLFKIRQCQNIEGQALTLPLLAPPIDPAILVRAKAMGVDIDSVLGELYAPLPHYRFQILAQKATELCSEVKSLGAAILSALEKRDGEALALLRNAQETRLLQAIQVLKEQQIEETKLTLEGLPAYETGHNTQTRSSSTPSDGIHQPGGDRQLRARGRQPCAPDGPVRCELGGLGSQPYPGHQGRLRDHVGRDLRGTESQRRRGERSQRHRSTGVDPILNRRPGLHDGRLPPAS